MFHEKTKNVKTFINQNKLRKKLFIFSCQKIQLVHAITIHKTIQLQMRLNINIQNVCDVFLESTIKKNQTKIRSIKHTLDLLLKVDPTEQFEMSIDS